MWCGKSPCASPTFLSAAKPASPCGVGNPLVNGTVTLSSLEEEPLPDSHRFDSPPSSGHVQDSFVTPHHRCSSPYTQSRASSEFSFHLPSPFYPWAPPSLPINLQQQSRSLPTTPTHATPTSRTHLRYSQDITSRMCSNVYPLNFISEDGLSLIHI